MSDRRPPVPPPSRRHPADPGPTPTDVLRRLWGAGGPVRAGVLLLFLVSLAARVALLVSVQPELVSDARDYRVLAENLAAGRGYVQEYHGETEAFQGFTFRAFRPPGYPLLLAGLLKLGCTDPRAPLVLNLLADLVTQACFLLITTRVLGSGAALLVQALLAGHVLWTPNPMTESVFTALLALLACLLVFDLPRRSWPAALLFGLLSAAALFVRPIAVCVYPALAWHWRHRPDRRRLARFALVLLPAACALSAWTLRNYRLFGVVVPFTTNFGHHNAYEYGIPADYAFAQLRAQGLNEAEINRELIRLEWEAARANPAGWLKLWAWRVRDLFSPAPAWEVRNVLWKRLFGPRPDDSLVFRLYRAAYAQYHLTYPLAGLGAIALLLKRRRLDGLGSLLLAYVLIHGAVSRGDIRLAAPLYPILCVLVAGLAVCLRDLARRHQEHQAAPA